MTDMSMSVDKSGNDIILRSIDNFGLFAPGMFGASSEVANPAVDNCDLQAVDDFTGININELTAGYNRIRFYVAHRPANQTG